MKRFLCAGEGYGLFSKISNRKQRLKMACLITGLAFVISIWGSSAYATNIETKFVAADSNLQQVYGWVKTGLSNLPIEGARIRVEDSHDQTFTDQNGYFELTTEQIQKKILVSHYSFQDTSVSFDLNLRPDLHVRMKPQIREDQFIVPGDTIPDSIWDLPLNITNHKEGRKSISLREFSEHRLIVFYTWATWCKPCVEKVERWNTLQATLPAEVVVFPTHLSLDQYGLEMTTRRNWGIPVLFGDACYVLEQCFFNRTYVGSNAVILDGKFKGIYDSGIDDLKVLEEILTTGELNVPMNIELIHQKKGGLK